MNYDVNEVAFMDYVFDFQQSVKMNYTKIDQDLSVELFLHLADQLIELGWIDHEDEMPFDWDEFVTV